MSEDFALDLTGEDIANANPNAGGSFHRVKFGDYRFKITGAEQQAKEGEKPHVMLVLSVGVVHAYDKANAGEIGQELMGRYAGSRQSPKMMQDRLANLIRACQIVLKPGQQLTRSALIGREFDGSVIWNKGKPQMNMETGETKTTVFANVLGERPVGAPRPPTIDPARDSREAAKYLQDLYGDDSTDDAAPVAAAAPWTAQTATEATAIATAGSVGANTTPSWRDESEADPVVHQYRAHIKLETAHAGIARDGLIKSGFDPDGAVDATKLDDALRTQFHAKFPPASGGLPGLPGLGNGAVPAAKATKGTRAPRAAQ